MPPIINEEKCTRCNTCAQICSMDVFGPVRHGEVPRPIYWRDCWHCRACVMDCPAGAISMRYPLPMMMLTNESGRDGERDREVLQWNA